MRWIARVLSTALLLGIVALMWPTTLGGATSYVKVSGRSMLPKLHDGDLVVTRAVGHYGPGDVVAYRVPHGQVGAGQLVVHRIVGGSPTRGFRTRGDNRAADDLWRPKTSDILGEKWIVVPHAGQAMGSLRSPLVLAAFAAALAVSVAVGLVGHERSPGANADDEQAPEPPVILVVDDQSAFRRGVARMLSDSGYTVREADDGCSAAVAARAVPEPSLVLCDIVLPGMSGPDVLTELSKIGLRRGVLMSGRAPDVDGDLDRPFLRKPFLESELLELVRRELEEEPVSVGSD